MHPEWGLNSQLPTKVAGSTHWASQAHQIFFFFKLYIYLYVLKI